MQAKQLEDGRGAHSACRQLGMGRRVALLLAVALVSVGAGCTERKPATESYPLPLSTAGAQALQNPPRNVPEDVQELEVVIRDGRFESDRYSVQTRPVSMRVTAHGGPYTLQVESFVQPRQVPANATAIIAFTAPQPGDYTIRVSGPSGEGTAILNVRPTGGR